MNGFTNALKVSPVRVLLRQIRAASPNDTGYARNRES
jgi:hypothetical protein